VALAYGVYTSSLEYRVLKIEYTRDERKTRERFIKLDDSSALFEERRGDGIKIELDEWEMILDASSSEIKWKELSMVEVFLGGVWGEETVETVEVGRLRLRAKSM